MASSLSQFFTPRVKKTIQSIILVLMAIAVARQLFSRLTPSETASNLVGKEAPDFVLPTINGSTVHLSSQKGKLVVLDFWATWCGPCVRSLPHLEALQKELKPKGLQVIGVNIDGDRGEVERFFAGRTPEIIVALDDKGISRHYGVETIPHIVIVDSEGKIRSVTVGSIGEHRLRAKILDALSSN